MKFLLIFIDMLAADNLHLCNEQTEMTALDESFKKLGGTLYTNYYVPAPDTSRSAGCMWTGLYPKANGCDSRLKYPGYFLKPEVENFWDIFAGQGYSFNIFLRESNVKNGTLPMKYGRLAYKCDKGNDINGFLKSVDLCENSVTFLYLSDLHTYVDIYKATKEGYAKGDSFEAKMLDKVFRHFDADAFDHIFIFSDHGFRFAGPEHRHLLERDRIKTVLLWRQKGQKELRRDASLRTVMDLFPTICDILDYQTSNVLDGKSLLGEGHEYVLFEEHRQFEAKVGMTAERWAVLWHDKLYWLDCEGWDLFEDPEAKDFDADFFEKAIAEKMSDYAMNKRITESIKRQPDIVASIGNDQYSDGTPICYPDGTPFIIRQ